MTRTTAKAFGTMVGEVLAITGIAGIAMLVWDGLTFWIAWGRVYVAVAIVALGVDHVRRKIGGE